MASAGRGRGSSTARASCSREAEAGTDIPPEPQTVVPLLSPGHLSGRESRDTLNNCQSQAPLEGAQLTGNRINNPGPSSRGGTAVPPPGEQLNESNVLLRRVAPDNVRIENRVGELGDIVVEYPANEDRDAENEVVAGPNDHDDLVCPQCGRRFASKRGLGVHRQKAHREEYNAEISVERVKARWTPEETRLMAWEEINAPPGTRFMNEYLIGVMNSERTLEAIKGKRRAAEYTNICREIRERARPRPVPARPPLADQLAEQVHAREGHQNDVHRLIVEDQVPGVPPAPQGGNGRQAILEAVVESVNGMAAETASLCLLKEAVRLVTNGGDPSEPLEEWARTTYPNTQHGAGRQHVTFNMDNLSRKEKRRHEYKAMQKLWGKNLSKAARKVLDGDSDSENSLPLRVQEPYWRGIFEERPGEGLALAAVPLATEPALAHVWAPITPDEILDNYPPAKSSPGPDGLTVAEWKKTSVEVQTLVMNIILVAERVPAIWRDSRTVLIPKQTEAQEPALYRPISISSVVLRHLHKVLSSRLSKMNLLDARQRAFIAADGCAENVLVLASAIRYAKKDLKPLYCGILDVRKAFDTVTHEGIEYVLRKKGLPIELVRYVGHLYENSSTVIEVGGETSDFIRLARGVRQGDPLSPFLFNLVIDEVLEKINPVIGVDINGVNGNVLAFADDLVLLASTRDGMQRSLDTVSETLAKFGLSLMATKCSTLVMLPSGKDKKMKIVTERPFTVAGSMIPEVGVVDRWKYLGVTFDCRGVLASTNELAVWLKRIKSAPLKPQQRWRILVTYMIPRLLHGLVLGSTTHGALRRIDMQVKRAAREWFRLPKDTPVAFFHAPVREGGLGIQSMESSIPELKLRRLGSLQQSLFPAARAASRGEEAQRTRRWCGIARVRNRDWPRRLHTSVDGFDLRECSKVGASHGWFVDDFTRIPSHEWLEYIRTRINALPSRMRTTRGARRNNAPYECRAGCGVPETTAHIIQQCHRTHGGRIERHNAVARVIAKSLRAKGFVVTEERVYATPAGARKPDIIARGPDNVHVIDCQIVSGSRPLSANYNYKKRYYAENAPLIDLIANESNIRRDHVNVEAITVTWKGVWALESASALTRLGVPKSTLRGITTRIINGSHLNFARFNRMTTMAQGLGRYRR